MTAFVLALCTLAQEPRLLPLDLPAPDEHFARVRFVTSNQVALEPSGSRLLVFSTEAAVTAQPGDAVYFRASFGRVNTLESLRVHGLTTEEDRRQAARPLPAAIYKLLGVPPPSPDGPPAKPNTPPQATPIALVPITPVPTPPTDARLLFDLPAPEEQFAQVRYVTHNKVALELSDARFLVLNTTQPIAAQPGDSVYFRAGLPAANTLQTLRKHGRPTEADRRQATRVLPAAVYELLGVPIPPPDGSSVRVNIHPDLTLAAAQHSTARFLREVPSFIAHQRTIRRQAQPGRRFSRVDIIDCEVATHAGVETYRAFQRNGQKMTDPPLDRGTWSKGEFQTLLHIVVMNPATTYSNRAPDKVAGRRAIRYFFAVPREASQWQVRMSGQVYLPAFHGQIWIDEATARVSRIEAEADSFPYDFPILSAKTSAEHGPVQLRHGRSSPSEHWLPRWAMLTVCHRPGGVCTQNDIRFTNYAAFRTESKIEFGSPQ